MHTDESTSLVLPGQQPANVMALDTLPAVVWLRNPATGVINKFHKGKHDDTIERCLKDGHTLSSEAAAKRQAVELARLQGRPLPPWAAQADESDAQDSLTASESPAERLQRDERVAAEAREQNEAARKTFGVKSAK